MTTISAKTKDQVLTAVESPTVASGDKNTVDFSVELDEFWSGLTASAVFFTARNPQAVYEKILEKGKTQIPSEVLKNKGYMYIGIRAVDGEGGVKTSTVLKYRIEDGAPVGTATAEGPTPDVYQQLSLALNNLKTGVDKNATGISNNSNNIERLNEITESLDKDSSAAKMAIEELADKKITKFYASNLGENHLEDSDNGKIQDMFIYGRSEQKQYKGYNLLEITFESATDNYNVTHTNNGDGSITESGGTTTLATVNKLGEIDVVEGTTYYIAANASGIVTGSCVISLRKQDGTIVKNIAANDSIVAEATEKLNVMSRYQSPDTVTMRPMITKEQSASYEPYVGGIPSPNPDYPQEIRNVLNPSVMICGKNLIQCEDGKEYKLSNTTSNYIGVLVNYSGKINTQKGKKYTISFEYETSNPGIFCLNAFQNVITGNLLVKDNNIKSGKNKIAVTFVAEGIIKKVVFIFSSEEPYRTNSLKLRLEIYKLKKVKNVRNMSHIKNS